MLSGGAVATVFGQGCQRGDVGRSSTALSPQNNVANAARFCSSEVLKPQLNAESTYEDQLEFNVVTIDPNNSMCAIERRQNTYQTENLGNGITLDLMSVPAGTFTMGSPEYEIQRFDNESPQRDVTITKFWIGKYPVTQAQWTAVADLPKVKDSLDPDPSYFKGDKRPVEQIRWYDAVEFCQRLSQHTGKAYRLPSEAEWEYACRAGTTTPFHFGHTITPDLANYFGTTPYGQYGARGIYREQTTAVGSFNMANTWGLYDMHGNVQEWCLDYVQESYQGAPTDGTAWLIGGDNTARMTRGGSWNYFPALCRSASRMGAQADAQPSLYAHTQTYKFVGFRVVCTI